MMRRLTRRRQVKNRSKHSRKYKKTRSRKYIKKRRSVTRRRVLRGGDVNVQDIINAITNSSPERFKLLVDGLENNPDILHNINLQFAYKYKNDEELLNKIEELEEVISVLKENLKSK